VTILILSFVSIWNDYIYALVFLPQPERQTLTVALASARAEYAVSYGLLSASAIMAIVPVFVFYLFTKNSPISGMSEGGSSADVERIVHPDLRTVQRPGARVWAASASAHTRDRWARDRRGET